MKLVERFTQGPLYPLCFVISAFLLWLGYYLETEITIAFALVFFVIWDILFVVDINSFIGRDASFTIQQVVQARSYISYFIPFYGIMFGVLLSDKEKLEYFMGLLSGVKIPPELILMPLVLSVIVMLLFPLQVSLDSEGKKLTTSIKYLFVCNFFGQKFALYIFAHSFLRIAKHAFAL